MLIGLLGFLSVALFASAILIIMMTFKYKTPFFSGVFATAGAFLASFLTGIYRANLMSGTKVISVYIDEVFAALGKMLGDAAAGQPYGLFGGIPTENAQKAQDLLMQSIEAVKEAYILSFPAMLILYTLLASFVIYMLTKQVVALSKRDVSHFPLFSELILRRSATFILALALLLPRLIKSQMISAAFTNIAIILSGVAILCGISMIDFFLRRKLKNAWLRFALYIAAAAVLSGGLLMALMLMVFVAAADSLRDFRRLYGHREVNDDDGQ